MLDVTAASGLLTAESVIIVALVFTVERAEVPKQENLKGLLVGLMAVSYLSALACLHSVTFPNGFVGQLAASRVLFNVSMGSMGIFVLAMMTALFPEKVSKMLE